MGNECGGESWDGRREEFLHVHPSMICGRGTGGRVLEPFGTISGPEGELKELLGNERREQGAAEMSSNEREAKGRPEEARGERRWLAGRPRPANNNVRGRR